MNNKNVLIVMICGAVICFLAVGYAAYSRTLTINGTGSITSNWSVVLDTTTNTACTVTSRDSGKPSTCTVTKATNVVTAAIGFASPGDVVTLVVRALNQGSINATANLSARLYLTSSSSSACTNVTATGNYTQYNASGTATSGTAKTLTASAQTIGPATILNKTSNATYHYAVYTFTFTYNSSATAAAGACTFLGSLTASQAT